MQRYEGCYYNYSNGRGGGWIIKGQAIRIYIHTFFFALVLSLFWFGEDNIGLVSYPYFFPVKNVGILDNLQIPPGGQSSALLLLRYM